MTSEVNFLFLLIKNMFGDILIFFFFFQIPDAEKDPGLVAFKGRAFLNKGQFDQALQVVLDLLNV